MEAVATFFKVSLAEYFRTLPVPETIEGLLELSGKDWLRIIPTAGAIGLVVYLAVTKLRSGGGCGQKGQVNQSVQKDKAKVVHSIDVEDLGESSAFCRCWRSKEFPYCDGSHVAHNKATGDNVGPLCVSKKSE